MSLVPALGGLAGEENFDQVKPGQLPAGWVGGVTGGGNPKWSVALDTDTAGKNVLEQSGQGVFPWCVKKDVSLSDGFVEVKFKPIQGREDQAGGVVFRWKDADNYYVARANALEDNVRIYHVTKGKRIQFQGVDRKVTPGEWHTLRVDFAGNHFLVTFDGKKAFAAEDSSLEGAGAVGVWTKADSVTAFDAFRWGEK
jgi:hypothetical protein